MGWIYLEDTIMLVTLLNLAFIVEYGKKLANSGELGHLMEEIRWGNDHLLKAHIEPDVLNEEVSEGKSDHYCLQRP